MTSKNNIFYSLLFILTLSSCVKEFDKEEYILNNLPHFEYGGCTYFVHPTLGECCNGGYVRDVIDEQARGSYDYWDWFLPSINELKAAKSNGIDLADCWARDGIFLDAGGSCHNVRPMRKQ